MSTIIKSIKIKKNEKFIPIQILKNIIKSTTVPEQTIDEEDSELFFTTLHGIGKILFFNGNEYEGNVKYGVMNSLDNLPSKLTFSDGTVYIGNVINNTIDGEGTYTFPNKSVYSGEVKNGLRHGRGTFKSEEEEIDYEGEWKEGVKDGNGRLKIKNSLYEGRFLRGKKHGKGRIKWMDSGNYYDGDFKDNIIEGNGYMIWIEENEKYIGQFKSNTREGIGIQIWYETKGENKILKNRYIGEWTNGNRNGYGLIFYSNGSRYEGYFTDNIKNGYGMFVFQDGTSYIGRFENDRMVDDIENLSSPKKMTLPFNTNQTDIRKERKNSLMSSDNSKLIMLDRLVKEETTSSFQGKSDGNSNETSSRMGITHATHGGRKNLTSLKSGTKLFQMTTKPVESIIENVNEDDEEKSEVKQRKGFDVLQVKQMNEDGNRNNQVKISQSQSQKVNQNDENTFVKLINIEDLFQNYIFSELEDSKSISEIYNVLLRYVSDIKNWYKIYSNSNKESIDKYTSESKDEQIKQVATNKRSVMFKDSNKEKETLFIDGVNINNDIGYSMEMADVWSFIRDCGIVSQDFTLANFNRIFYKGSRNFIEYYIIPEDIKTDEETFEYLYSSFTSNKSIFENKYKSQAEPGNIHKIPYKKVNFQGKSRFFDVHDRKNVVLLRQFYEIIVRIAYLKYINLNETISKKLKLLIDNYIRLNSKLNKSKIKTNQNQNQNTSTQNMIQPQANTSITTNNLVTNTALSYPLSIEEVRLSSIESSIYETFIQNPRNESELFIIFKNLIEKLNKTSFNKEFTLTYKQVINYFTIKLKMKIEKYEVVLFVSKFFSSKIQITDDNKYLLDTQAYVETILNNDLIFFEFIEFFCFVCKKLLQKEGLDEGKENFIMIISRLFSMLTSVNPSQVDRLDQSQSQSDGNNLLESKAENENSLFYSKFEITFPYLPYHLSLENQIKEYKKKLEIERKVQIEKERVAYENRKMKEYEEKPIVIEYLDEEDSDDHDSYQ